MLKTLKTLFKQDKEKFVIPKSVQAIIPIKTIWEDGIFLVGNNKYEKTFKSVSYTHLDVYKRQVTSSVSCLKIKNRITQGFIIF